MKESEKQKIGSRIDERMTELNLSNVAVAAHVGISKVAVGKWRKGDTEPTGSNLTKLVQILKTNAEWITTGKGSKDSPIEPTELTRDEPGRDVIQRLLTGGSDTSSLISIPYLDARAACGPGAFNADTPDILGRYEISEDFLIRLGLPSDGRGLILIDSNGDSMAPSIPSDTPLLINTLEKCFNTLVNGKVYVFCANGAIICKRIYRNLDGTIKLHSDNSNKDLYPDQDVSEDLFNTFEVIGRLKFAFVEF